MRSGRSGAKSTSAPAFCKCLKAADGVVQARSGVEEIVRSHSQDKRKPECTYGFRGCSDPFDNQALIVRGLSWLPVASSIVHPTSPTAAASRIVSATTSGASPKPFSRSAETGKTVASNQARVSQGLIAGQPAVSSTKSRGGGSARCGQGPEAKADKNAGGADIPRIRNYEGARAVVKRAEASTLIVLRQTHRGYLEAGLHHATPSLTRMYCPSLRFKSSLTVPIAILNANFNCAAPFLFDSKLRP